MIIEVAKPVARRDLQGRMKSPIKRGLCLLLLPLGAVRAQSDTWRTLATFYGDNTEFFTPFRTGETILGGQFQTFLDIGLGERTSVRAGVFGDLRFGDDEFLDPVKPILSFRYATPATLFVLGTLETENRHGYLEPLEVTTLEFTRPIEYGGQLIKRHRRWDFDLYLNWQGLNTPTTREIFDYGLVLRVRPVGPLTLEAQMHGLHHGGQLFNAGVPVSNNKVSAIGARLADTLPVLGKSSVAGFYVSSKGFIDPALDTLPDRGHGAYLRLSVEPRGWLELFTIYWLGDNFHTDEGDPNYNSLAADGSFNRSRRRYFELGAIRRTMIDRFVSLDAEFRLHRVDDEPSQALFESNWEYSYRLVIRAPFSFSIHRPQPGP
jgi:hypothetical protein